MQPRDEPTSTEPRHTAPPLSPAPGDAQPLSLAPGAVPGLRLLDQVVVFTYATTEYAPTYRAMMQMFYAGKQRYVLELTPGEVLTALRDSPFQVESDIEARLDERLDALVRWGNLARSHDTAAVSRLEDFNRRRYVYRLTASGEAAHRAVLDVEAAVGRSGALQANMLVKIRDSLLALAEGARASRADPEPLMRHFHDLFAAFASLTQEASAFMGEVSRHTQQARIEEDDFLLRKQAIIVYLTRFLKELRHLKDEILTCLQSLSDGAVLQLLAIAATSQDLPPGLDDEDDPARRWCDTQAQRWAGVRAWFHGSLEAPPVVDRLSHLARQAVLDLMRLLSRLNEARSRAADRRADFLTLARWFSTCRDGDAAHALWHGAFGLYSARHFHLEEDDSELTTPQTSWWTAPPVRVPARTRANNTKGTRGRSAAAADYTTEKQFIAQRQRQERQQIQAAMRRFVGRGEVCLHQIASLDAAELDYFLVLLDEALTAPRDPNGTRHGTSSDGSLLITLRPPRRHDAPHVVLTTERGQLRCVNYRLAVEPSVGTAGMSRVAP